MKTNSKVFMWVLVTIIVMLIIYVVFVGKKPAPGKVNLFVPEKDPSNGTGPVPPIIPPDPVTASNQTFNIGDQIYAGSELTNAYTSCAPSSTNIDSTYKTGDLIGTFLRKQNSCIVIAVKTYPLGFSWIPFEGSKDVYLPLSALIYKQ